MTPADRIRARLAELDKERIDLERQLLPPVVLEGGRHVRQLRDLCSCPGQHGHPNCHHATCALTRLITWDCLGGSGWYDLTINLGAKPAAMVGQDEKREPNVFEKVLADERAREVEWTIAPVKQCDQVGPGGRCGMPAHHPGQHYDGVHCWGKDE